MHYFLRSFGLDQRPNSLNLFQIIIIPPVDLPHQRPVTIKWNFRSPFHWLLLLIRHARIICIIICRVDGLRSRDFFLEREVPYQLGHYSKFKNFIFPPDIQPRFNQICITHHVIKKTNMECQSIKMARAISHVPTDSGWCRA